jgi:hypothetical protein
MCLPSRSERAKPVTFLESVLYKLYKLKTATFIYIVQIYMSACRSQYYRCVIALGVNDCVASVISTMGFFNVLLNILPKWIPLVKNRWPFVNIFVTDHLFQSHTMYDFDDQHASLLCLFNIFVSC